MRTIIMTGMEGGKVVGIKLTSKGDLAREIKRVVGEKKDYDLDELKKLGKAARENLGSGKLTRKLNKVIKKAEKVLREILREKRLDGFKAAGVGLVLPNFNNLPRLAPLLTVVARTSLLTVVARTSDSNGDVKRVDYGSADGGTAYAFSENKAEAENRAEAFNGERPRSRYPRPCVGSCDTEASYEAGRRPDVRGCFKAPAKQP